MKNDTNDASVQSAQVSLIDANRETRYECTLVFTASLITSSTVAALQTHEQEPIPEHTLIADDASGSSAAASKSCRNHHSGEEDTFDHPTDNSKQCGRAVHGQLKPHGILCRGAT